MKRRVPSRRVPPRRVPPRIATWLLFRLGSDFYTESLAGDLSEVYQEGRTRLWYWRQIAVAIFMARTRFLRQTAWTIVDGVIAAFAMIALGVGTLTWANVVKKEPEPSQQCAPSISIERTAIERIGCAGPSTRW